MSHKATTWAIQQRGLKPAAKVVLWHLCDRYHPDHGCFPSQETLAHDCEMSRSGLNNQLYSLEQAGLIRREERRDEATNRQKSTRYRFAFEDSFEAPETAKPCPNSGHGAVSKKASEPCPKNEPSRVQTCGHEPVIEPVNQPEKERERDVERFEKALKRWPSGFADNRERALEAWLSLSSDDQRQAAEEIERFVNTTKAIGRSHFCSFATYLVERRWQALPDRPKRVDRASRAVVSAEPIKTPPTAFQLKNPHLYPELFATEASDAAS